MAKELTTHQKAKLMLKIKLLQSVKEKQTIAEMDCLERAAFYGESQENAELLTKERRKKFGLPE